MSGAGEQGHRGDGGGWDGRGNQGDGGDRGDWAGRGHCDDGVAGVTLPCGRSAPATEPGAGPRSPPAAPAAPAEAARAHMALYSAAAAVLAGLERGEGGLKSLVYNSGFPVRPEGAGVRGGRGESLPGRQELSRSPGARLMSACSAARPAAVRAGVRDPPLRLGAGQAAGWSRAAAGREEAGAAAGEGTSQLAKGIRGIPGPWCRGTLSGTAVSRDGVVELR